MSTENLARETLLDIKDRLDPALSEHYRRHSFRVRDGAARVGVCLRYHRKHRVQLYISLHDPNEFRGNRMNLSGYGDLETLLWVGADQAGPGGIPGPMPAGEWQVQIDIAHVNEVADYHLQVFAEYGQVETASLPVFPEGHVVRAEPGWYRGELHSHSIESDGACTVEQVVRAAASAGLDFLALTDHFTTSQWLRLAPLVAQTPLALLRSCEITSHQGHANMHGLKKWVDVFVDRPDWSMNQAADAVHAQGGLFCVNHPYSGECSWRAFDFDWKKADLIEIYHALEGPNNHQQVTLWDHLLSQGCRLVGVGGTDSHHPTRGNHALGRLVTWVYATELSEQGILKGLKAGNVFVSRGAELRFFARNARGEEAEMGSRVESYGEPVTFHLKHRATTSLCCFIYRNGLLWESRKLEDSSGEWREHRFSVKPELGGIFRVELHQAFDHPDYAGIDWHDFSTVQALSNPIWMVPS